jgi:hypothetical protein
MGPGKVVTRATTGTKPLGNAAQGESSMSTVNQVIRTLKRCC